MKLILSIIGIIAVLIAQGCDTYVQPGDLPYEKKLVISALLQAGKPVNQILIGKTLPPDQNYIVSQAAVTNANAFISVESDTYPLIFDGNYQLNGMATGFAIYRAQGLIPEPGKTYSITVEAEGLRATSSTTVPPTADIDSLTVWPSYQYGAAQYWLHYWIKQQPGVTYAIGYSFSPSVVQDIVDPPTNVMKSAVGSVIDHWISVGGWRPDLSDSLAVVIFSYDDQFYDYYLSYQNYAGPSSIFGQSNGRLHWNVHGDGIGLFIGATVTRQRVASQ